MVIAAVWENHTDTCKQLKYHFHWCVQCFVKGQTTEPISNLHTAFISLSTLTVCVITLSKWENLAWCHLSWWLMRSDKASWDIWHILSSLKAWNNPNIHVHQQWLAKRFYRYYCRGKAEAEKIDFSLMSFTLFELRKKALPGLNAIGDSRKPWKCLYFWKVNFSIRSLAKLQQINIFRIIPPFISSHTKV